MSLIQDALKKVQGGPSVRPPLGGVQYGRGRSSRSKWPWGLIGASVAAIAPPFFFVESPGRVPARTAPILEERVASPVQVGPPDGRPPRVVEKLDPTPPVEGDALSSAPPETAPKRPHQPGVDGKESAHFNM